MGFLTERAPEAQRSYPLLLLRTRHACHVDVPEGGFIGRAGGREGILNDKLLAVKQTCITKYIAWKHINKL